MTHLFLFTLGPVQGFIAQARKAHDLHSGSKLLSELCRVAAIHFTEVHSGDIIFPDINSDSIPNRFLGKITCDTNQLSDIGKSVADAVRDSWKIKFDKSLNELLENHVYAEAIRQIEQHLDIQWLFQSLADESDEVYRKAYDDLNKNLNALKNTRLFHTPEETGRKCSLDGERNVIFYRKTEKQQTEKTDNDLQKGNPLYSETNILFPYQAPKNAVIQLRHLQPGEGLSAVSMLKRFHDFDADAFPDTAEFALSETMYKIGNSCLNDMTLLLGHDHPKHLNWQLFFEENLTERYFKKQGLPEDKREKAKKIQKELSDTARENGRKLEKYYAIVVFDGDHMGEWWKGSRLKSGVSLESFHQKLTEKLAEFARNVRQEYPRGDHRGWVIYAGGDDFLGFFNLHHLTKGIEFLRDEYQRIVHEPLNEDIKNDYQLTFSAGVCIAHYKEPLSLVLAQARKMEHEAKKKDEEKKNAIGISVIPGSGQIAEVVLRFEDFPHLGTVITDLQSADFSNAFVSKARTELAAFIDNTDKKQIVPELSETAQSLLDRAVYRACNLKKRENESEAEFKKRKKVKVEPLQLAVKALLAANAEDLPAFFDALDIADFIERQTHISSQKDQNEPTHETTT